MLMSTANQPFLQVIKQDVTSEDTSCCYPGRERKDDDGLISNP